MSTLEQRAWIEQSVSDRVCPNCHRYFDTSYGRNTHLRQNLTCMGWISNSKQRAVEEPEDKEMAESGPFLDHGYTADMFETENDIFSWMDPQTDIEIGEAGPGPSTLAESQGLKRMLAGLPHALNQKQKEVVWEPHRNGGKVIRMSETLYEKWTAKFGLDQRDGPESVEDQLYAPFASKLDWRIAQWAITENVGQGSLDRLLKIPGVLERLELSFHNSRRLNKIVDAIPARGGSWHTKEFRFSDAPDETMSVRYRDPLEAIKALWGDPSLAEHLVYKPSKMFSDSAKTTLSYSEMWTGKWWWAMQNRLKSDATIAPVIIATDKTQLTQFSGSRSAYPVYITLGNIPRQLRRRPSQQACILIAYLPVGKIAKKGLAKREHNARYARLFHESMRFLLSPVAQVSKSGLEMVGGDGKVRRVHPIISCYVADYPEQCLVGCTKYGTCPKCQCSADDLQDMDEKPKRTQIWTIDVMDTARIQTRTVPQYVKYCMAREVSGYVYKPFWRDFWGTDVHMSMTPDVLHQLYQGVFKHLVGWCQEIMTEEELDRRVRCLPAAMGVRHFRKGWSALSQISGSERKHMARILLACLVGSVMPTQAIRACRAILDFVYLAQYTSHDEDTLLRMQKALETWEENRHAFVKQGTREDFNIPKFHSLVHYTEMIRLFGATDNYNTEMFERLHIDFAKKGWRASNKRNEFPQMTTWLSRQENVVAFNRYIRHRKREQQERQEREQRALGANKGVTTAEGDGQECLSATASEPPPTLALKLQSQRMLHLTKAPSAHRTIASLELSHNIPHFGRHLATFLSLHQGIQLGELPFTSLDLYQTLKFTCTNEEGDEIQETLHCSPTRRDPVIVLTKDSDCVSGLNGTRIGRVQAIFILPSVIKLQGLGSFTAPKSWPTYPLAYVEWYTKPMRSIHERDLHGFYSVSKAYGPDKTTPQWSFIPLCNIRQTCMLIPNFKKSPLSDEWTSQNVLDKADHFFVNNRQSVPRYKTF
ncbi:hypothetical protein V5O48_018083 [Marasmius crinis-equi]|uniref:Uncharacterized protein n=1 Tax=Marasmius crinis-equi TaxID=585013 RepID=A0ABR3EM67_9AGAR